MKKTKKTEKESPKKRIQKVSKEELEGAVGGRISAFFRDVDTACCAGCANRAGAGTEGAY